MLYLAKTLFSGRQWLVYVLAGVLVLAVPALLLQFAEVILDFCLGGIVPGTDIIIPPETVMWSVVGLLSLGVVVFVWRSALLTRRRRMHLPVVTKSTAAVTAPMVAVTPNGHVQENPRTKSRSVFAYIEWRISFRAVGRILAAARAYFISGLRSLGSMLVWLLVAAAGFLQRVWAIARMLMKRGLSALRALIGGVQKFSMRALRRSGIIASDIWQWAEPHLWKFDAWLELQLRKTEGWIARKIAQNDRLRILRLQLLEIKKSTVIVIRRTIRTVRQKIGLSNSE